MKKQTELSIIIVTYNSECYIKDCLNSVVENCVGINYEILVFDNNSGDKTLQIIKTFFKEVKTIESDTNKGFAKGNNEAVKQSFGEYVLLLNHDTILKDQIKVVLDTFKRIPDAGALGIKMLDAKGNYRTSVGKFPKPVELIKFSLFNEKSEEFISGNFSDPEKIRFVDWVSGAFLLTKKVYWEKVGGLDEQYFMYVEDVDFCKRLSLIGKQTVFLPSLSYIHYVGFNNKRELQLIKGYKIFAEEFYNKYEKLIANIALSINHGYKKIFKGLY